MRPSRFQAVNTLIRLVKSSIRAIPFFMVLSVAGASESRPNIVFILVDDQSPFNLASNPSELLEEHASKEPMQKNLATDPAYATHLSEMQSILLPEMRCLHDPYRFSDQPDDNLQTPGTGKSREKKAK